MYSFQNLDQTLIGMSRIILEQGQWRDVRGFKCLEIPHPVMIEITNPTDRYITIPSRKWNKTLPWAESLWMALGLNDLDSLPGRYVKNLYTYSDNGRTWRGGYGPRLRAFSGLATDYDVSIPRHRRIFTGFVKTVDQLRYVVESLKRDIHTRQAIISLGDPVKDCFDERDHLKKTKDYPCSRSLQFMMVDGALNCSLYIRSNDILFGLSAVNVTNFTIMLEYVANILGVPVGKYYHIANNLHVYKEQHHRIVEFSKLDPKDFTRSRIFVYPQQFKDLKHFDKCIEELYHYEQLLHQGEAVDPVEFEVDMITDWGRVFYNYKYPDSAESYINPYLNT